MTERQRTGRPRSSDDRPEDDPGESNLDDVRDLADQLMANARRSLRALGVNDAKDFLHATRQSGGQ